MIEPIIKIKDLEITYNKGKENEFRASDGVNMEIYPNEYIIFFGPSGCGKSTVLYSILGVLAPTSGEVIVKSENIYNYSPEELVKFQVSTIGIMYQAFYLISSLSVGDNVSLPLIFQGKNPSVRKKRAQELLDRFGIGAQYDKFPDALSGGQSQRVSVARAFVNDPEILLADEPVGNLDSTSADHVMETLDEINRKDKKTIILVTHDAKYLPYAHRVYYMKDGKVVRVVPNPERKQMAPVDIQKTLVTEMEQLAKMYPYLSPSELKVKSIINYLTQDFTFEQLQRLEKCVRLMIEGKISDKKFFGALTEDFCKGGVGAGTGLAEVMTKKVSKILNQAVNVRRYRRRMEQNMFYNTEKKLIAKLTKYLADECSGKLDGRKLGNIKELVYKRLAGLANREEFERGLGLPEKENGVGLKKEIAPKLAHYFEKLLIQGLETEDNEH